MRKFRALLWNSKKPKKGGLKKQILGGLRAYKKKFKRSPKFVFCRKEYLGGKKEKEMRIETFNITLTADNRIAKSHFVIAGEKDDWLISFDPSKVHGPEYWKL